MSAPDTIAQPCFTQFEAPIEGIALPERFTYPFFYEPHPLTLLAASQLQHHLRTQTEWQHDFGIDHHVDGVNIGKMFGVLVVHNEANKVGFLSAFSGKLAGQNHWSGFVPPVADILSSDGFFRKEEKVIEQVTAQLETLEQATAYQHIKDQLQSVSAQAATAMAASKAAMKAAKNDRHQRREQARLVLDEDGFARLEEALQAESKRNHFENKDLGKHWKAKLVQAQQALEAYEARLLQLREERRNRSAALQQQIFDQYQFLNGLGQTRGVSDIFSETAFRIPPSGAGDCALPKLLQYAYLHGLKPLAMAEFWWGQAPGSEIRKHGYFYPSCKGKCEPILSHMLQGIAVDESPMLKATPGDKKLEIIYEDDHLLVVNKPHEFLSVPGKTHADSVLARMAKRYPEATGPLLVHRLDRATSGLMLVAKTKAVHKDLQRQFLERTIKKKYLALLEGVIRQDEGIIDLPLRPDIEDRPRQLVCHTHGKPATTRWKVIQRSDTQTRMHLWPETGRTHQLRVHVAHIEGLDTPMVGDDLYGRSGERLCLQAMALEFVHPVSNARMNFELPPDF